MKKLFMSGTAVLCVFVLQAQSIRVPAGKKMLVVTEMKSSIGVSAMGQDMDIETSNTVTSDYEITAVTAKGYTLRVKVSRMQSGNKTMGMETNFDSDKEADRNDPMFAAATKLIGQPSEIVVENHTASVTSGELVNSMAQFGLKDNAPDMMKFVILKTDLDKMKMGYQWTDSLKSKDFNIVNEYVVTATSATEMEVSVKTMNEIHTIVQQQGAEGKVSFHGITNGKRYYDKSSGLLIREESDSKMDGDTEIMGQKIPMKIASKTTTAVK